MTTAKEIEPIERDGFCHGCKEFKKLFRVSASRYRCNDCYHDTPLPESVTEAVSKGHLVGDLLK